MSGVWCGWTSFVRGGGATANNNKNTGNNSGKSGSSSGTLSADEVVAKTKAHLEAFRVKEDELMHDLSQLRQQVLVANQKGQSDKARMLFRRLQGKEGQLKRNATRIATLEKNLDSMDQAVSTYQTVDTMAQANLSTMQMRRDLEPQVVGNILRDANSIDESQREVDTMLEDHTATSMFDMDDVDEDLEAFLQQHSTEPAVSTSEHEEPLPVATTTVTQPQLADARVPDIPTPARRNNEHAAATQSVSGKSQTQRSLFPRMHRDEELENMLLE